MDAALSDPQVVCRRGYTTSQQALRMSTLLHQYGDGALICLLDVTKAYPNMPHECLTYGLRLIGTPARIYNMVASIYAHNTGVCKGVRFLFRRGIKERCPLSPANQSIWQSEPTFVTQITSSFCSGVSGLPSDSH